MTRFASARAPALELRPDVVTMDINIPGMSGVGATRAIHARIPCIHIIGLWMFAEDEQAAAMLAAGPSAYLAKSAAADALVRAIRTRVGPRGRNAQR